MPWQPKYASSATKPGDPFLGSGGLLTRRQEVESEVSSHLISRLHGSRAKQILWMDEICSHHLRNPGMIRFPCECQRTTVSHGFKVVQEFVHSRTPYNNILLVSVWDCTMYEQYLPSKSKSCKGSWTAPVVGTAPYYACYAWALSLSPRQQAPS